MRRQCLRLVAADASEYLTELSDDEVMGHVAADSRNAFGVLVRRYQPLVCGMASRFLGDVSGGRDVAQDVFLTVWLDRRKYIPQGAFERYLATLCIHRCHVVSRQHRRSMKRDDRWRLTVGKRRHDSGELPFRQLLSEERRKWAQAALTRLSDDMRWVVILRFFNELSLNEIVETTGLPMGTVKSHLVRGVRYLCRFIDQEVLR